MSGTHRYTVGCSWSGSTGAGYAAYNRNHEAQTSSITTSLPLSADSAFGGDPGQWNPEQLLLLAAASCQLLSFLAVAARARLDILKYEDNAVAEMPEDDAPTRLARIVLHPTITVAAPVSEERVRHLVEVAHRECYVANSLKTEVQVEPTIVVGEPPG